ncbi:gliding motility-associated C-terminal domain-containing protein [Flavobacterium sp. NRK F7]|uniref:gliding motility-associated C-terminal domain-containing protein n=1 Tax=Flavobacterium sp. NRK F7 TaxID=2954930 RepID=UPI00209042E2|nr:gliding motility-associated C-terminal domain-containing protein [Flavobacterium sp. NRK F7]MCO6163595.1 gliding motility-associated C-terminal domain-containing protein [Flavobacterium sp. NRK F7]
MRRCKFVLIMFIISFFVYNYDGYAQCAGDNNSITICNKETYNQGIGNPNGVVNLFLLLGGTPSPGGTWINLNSSGGLNTTTGILNTWQINQSGNYNYQYVNNTIPGCTNNTAIITLTLGGFPGVDNPSAVACDNNTSVPLFSFLGSSPNPHFNGIWTGGPAGSITGNFFNAEFAGVGTYTLTYTVPAIGSCPSRSANVTLTVHPLPESGVASSLTFCETDDFSTLTNVDLFNLLAGEDTGGFWTDNFPTGEISGAGDSFINIENIVANFGPGTYTFTYNVNPTHPICTPATSNVAITIEPVVDLNGATLTLSPTPICFNDLSTTSLTGTIIQGANSIPNGTYDITYVLSGANNGSETVSVTFAGGTGSFTVNPVFVTTIGTTTVAITNVINSNSATNCTRIINNLNSSFTIAENPDATDTQISVANFCVGQNAQVNLTDINNNSVELSDDRYIITYILTDPNGQQTTQTTVIQVVNGNALFSLISSLTNIPGNYSITITNIQNEATGCSTTTNLNSSFIVYPIPDVSNLTISIDDTCSGDDVVVNLSNATNLTDGLYDIEYSISGAISVSNLTAINVSFTSGSGSFILPNSILVEGTSTLSIANFVSVTTLCGTATSSGASDSFTILPLPNTTGATINANNICILDIETITIENASSLTNGDYTLSYDLTGANNSNANSIVVTFINGSAQFDIPSTLLENGGTTTITIQTITSNTTTCGSSDLATNPVSFTITDPGEPTLAANGNQFCIQDLPNPTIADLNANITSSGIITWYDAPTGGNSYALTDPITNGTTYYASLTDAQGCEGSSRLEVTVDLANCPDLFIPDGFSPNNDGLNETFYIKNIDIIYPNFELEIFNRYGNLVYKGNINTPDFDGKSTQSTILGNDILPTGVYYYVLYYNDATNKKPTQGRLYLSR